jgi:hypothetical protein
MLRAASEVIGELSNPQPVPEVTQKKSQEFLNQLRVSQWDLYQIQKQVIFT